MATLILIFVTLLLLIALPLAGILALKAIKVINDRIDQERIDKGPYEQERALYAYCERHGDGSVNVILKTITHSIIICGYASKDKHINAHFADDVCDNLNYAIRVNIEDYIEDDDDNKLLEDDPEDDNETEH